jgi:hypothetical protein
MTGRPAPLLRQGAYSLVWVKDSDDRTSNSEPLLDAWQYVVKLVRAGAAGRTG